MSRTRPRGYARDIRAVETTKRRAVWCGDTTVSACDPRQKPGLGQSYYRALRGANAQPIRWTIVHCYPTAPGAAATAGTDRVQFADSAALVAGRRLFRLTLYWIVEPWACALQ